MRGNGFRQKTIFLFRLKYKNSIFVFAKHTYMFLIMSKNHFLLLVLIAQLLTY